MMATPSIPHRASVRPPSGAPISRARLLFSEFRALAVTQLIGFDQSWQQGVLGRSEQRGEGGLGADHGQGDRQHAERIDRQQPGHSQARGKGGDDHHPLAVPSVHIDAGECGQQEVGDQLSRDDERRGDGGAGARVDVEREGGQQQPVAGHGDEATEPQQGKVPPAQYREHGLGRGQGGSVNLQQPQRLGGEDGIQPGMAAGLRVSDDQRWATMRLDFTRRHGA